MFVLLLDSSKMSAIKMLLLSLNGFPLGFIVVITHSERRLSSSSKVLCVLIEMLYKMLMSLKCDLLLSVALAEWCLPAALLAHLSVQAVLLGLTCGCGLGARVGLGSRCGRSPGLLTL